ncbi:hypothetical protein ElyMa_001636900 [Elysia marginata]|uniref:Uncharacterized protein n=1 Tax=Elysia marginata TaxID=1093978 RepID=A0AAV4JN33_9GAST|nr:hypothetical protein ElyMa_001636900 [Elysia marginata]
MQVLDSYIYMQAIPNPVRLRPWVPGYLHDFTPPWMQLQEYHSATPPTRPGVAERDRGPVPLTRLDPLLELRYVSDHDGRDRVSVTVVLTHDASQHGVTVPDAAYNAAPVKLDKKETVI